MNFQKLTDLVTFDIMASLPMSQGLRMMKIGTSRLQWICSKPWVSARMSVVSATDMVQASLDSGDIEKSMCSDQHIRRLYGTAVIDWDKLSCRGNYT